MERWAFVVFCHFNIIMLRQQDWRIISKPNTLFSNLFKAKYFPNGNFLNAIDGSNPSFYLEKFIAFSGFTY